MKALHYKLSMYPCRRIYSTLSFTLSLNLHLSPMFTWFNIWWHTYFWIFHKHLLPILLQNPYLTVMRSVFYAYFIEPMFVKWVVHRFCFVFVSPFAFYCQCKHLFFDWFSNVANNCTRWTNHFESKCLFFFWASFFFLSFINSIKNKKKKEWTKDEEKKRVSKTFLIKESTLQLWSLYFGQFWRRWFIWIYFLACEIHKDIKNLAVIRYVHSVCSFIHVVRIYSVFSI